MDKNSIRVSLFIVYDKPLSLQVLNKTSIRVSLFMVYDNPYLCKC